MLWLKVFVRLSIGSIIILNIGLSGLYYFFKYDKGESIKDEIERIEGQKNAVQKKINDLKANLNDLQEMDKAMNRMGGEVNRLLKFIPNKVTSSMILNHLNIQAKSAGVDLEDINNRGGSETEGFYEKLKISVTVKGLFAQILVFLSKLTSLSEVVTVENFDLIEVQQRGQQVGGLKEVKMKMDIYGYRYITPIVVQKNENKKQDVTQ